MSLSSFASSLVGAKTINSGEDSVAPRQKAMQVIDMRQALSVTAKDVACMVSCCNIFLLRVAFKVSQRMTHNKNRPYSRYS
jgi:hypothetical protein